MASRRGRQDGLPRRNWGRTLGWCSRADVLTAFHIVGQEIRLKCQRFAAQGLSLGEACDLARRIKDQRDLVHQIADRRNAEHVRRLLRLNRLLRLRFLTIVQRAGLDKGVLICK
jgi:uncharacterized protein YoaH (UPF0181 family)